MPEAKIAELQQRCQEGTLLPSDLGLPEHFRRYHDIQLQALQAILNSQARVILLQAPTGTGKTLLMASLPPLLDTKVLYTCHTKALQEQVAGDFPDSVELKGRANYPCLKDPLELTADDCLVEKQNCLACSVGCAAEQQERARGNGRCPCASSCPYLIQKRLALEAPLAILNVPLFLAEANYVGGFSGWPWLVLDEGDLTEASLMDFVGVIITAWQIERLDLSPPRAKTVPEAWIEWAITSLPRITSRAWELEDTGKPRDIREAKGYRRLAKKLEFLIDQDLEYWAFIPEEARWSFRPIFVSSHAAHNLWGHAERFLAMSATIIDPQQFARDLGLKAGQWEFIDLPSTFPRETRPILFLPRANMTHKTSSTAWPQAVQALDEVLDRHPDEKGLVHTVSYPLASHVLENSRHAPRLIVHNPKNRYQVLEQFKAARAPLVLVSPSMERGVDLPYDCCRFIVVLKVPYLQLKDPQVQRRVYGTRSGPQWYAVQAIRSLVQATGRGTRAADDYCISYILDAQFERLYREHQHLFPAWWREALERESP